MTDDRHVPVMCAEVVEALAPRPGAIYVDATFGAGGYSQALLAAASCAVWAIDRDPAAADRAAPLADRFDQRLAFVPGCFGDMVDLLGRRGITAVDGIAFDLGVSSPQIDDPERGFSFRFDGPLDMRMGADGPTAADLVNSMNEGDLARLIFDLGEERRARRVARAIAAARAEAPITRTGQLADLVRAVVPAARDGIDPATRTFQALRMRVNDELGEVDRGLRAAERLLRPGGRLAVVSFHSLEDRRVKVFLRQRSGGDPAPSRHQPAAGPARTPSFRLVHRNPLKPSAAETATNPRARSARLRVAERTEAQPWEDAA